MTRHLNKAPWTLLALTLLGFPQDLSAGAKAVQHALRLADFSDEPTRLKVEVDATGKFTWWLPAGADRYILPISGGVAVDPSNDESMRWLRKGSPWSLSLLPTIGARYGDQTAAVIIPWPHYAQLVVEDRLGIRYSFPQDRRNASPAEIIILRRNSDPLAAAYAFREWRQHADTIGALPRPRSLGKKIAAFNKAERLLGAPHFYLWGTAVFSRHDIPRNKWLRFAQALQGAPVESFGGKLTRTFTDDQRPALKELAGADWPMNYLTVTVAGAIDTALARRSLLALDAELPAAEVVRRNKQALAKNYAGFVQPPATWGDGLCKSLLDDLRGAGIERALLLLSDLYSKSALPAAAEHAEKLGFLVGPYDSYHSVHSPTAGPDNTWETAQFDAAAYEQGRVINADGSGHAGFKGRGFHFSPQAAWPYVQSRVNGIIKQTPYSAWFIDCDATAECFDDFSSEHPANKLDDSKLRRRRLRWLEADREMVVGSEGGSALFSDVIHFGHGVHTPYIGHLDPAFRDRKSPHYLGRHWPPDTPEQSFKAVPLPDSLRSPYFDPTIRIPLYQAALGDELIVTHHWSFDSLKFKGLETTRELLEILYRVPPMYHLNRETWPQRRAHILRHLGFWGPLHQKLAAAPLVDFTWLTTDRLLQRTTFETTEGEATVTVNFSAEPRAGFPPLSATAAGAIDVRQRVYRPAD